MVWVGFELVDQNVTPVDFRSKICLLHVNFDKTPSNCELDTGLHDFRAGEVVQCTFGSFFFAPDVHTDVEHFRHSEHWLVVRCGLSLSLSRLERCLLLRLSMRPFEFDSTR